MGKPGEAEALATIQNNREEIKMTINNILRNPTDARDNPWKPDVDARGKVPESWNCVDCGVNTAPGIMTRIQIETALTIGTSTEQSIDEQSEVYYIKPKIWK